MSGLDKTKILIADDDEEIRDFFMLAMSCELPDCRIDLAVNGLEVVEAFRTVHYGVIVMDLRMPRMDGEEAFKEIVEICAQDNLDIPAVVFCTGFEPPDSLQDLIDSDMRHCILRKPVDQDILVEALRTRM